MTSFSPVKMRDAHRILSEMKYNLAPVERGYANRTLYVNVSTGAISSKPVTAEMKEIFTGGRGFCLWLLWNGIKDDTKWNDPENEIVISAGPIAGITNYPGTGKSTVVTISPLTNSVIDSNGGSYFGPYLKFSGWDAIEVQGKAEKDVIIYIDGDEGIVRIEEAPLEDINTHLLNRELTEMYAKDKADMRSISVVSAGEAADHVAMCGLNLSYYDARRDEVRIKQAARGGAGTVLRDKRIKAIVVRFSRLSANTNGAVNMELLRKAGKRINRELAEFDGSQNDMAHTGTTYLVGIMNDYDLLPVENYRFGKDDKAVEYYREEWKKLFDTRGPDGCWYGCQMACAHGVSEFELKTGPYAGQKVFVDGPEYETIGAIGSNLGIFDRHFMLELNFYCDTYGIDTISFGTSLAFVYECYEAGVITKEDTGGLEFTWGNGDVALEVVHQMARGEGFGMIIGQGIRAMKKIFTEKYGADPAFLEDIGMEVKGLEVSMYMTKESVTQQGGYAMANKGAQHDEAWLIFMELVHKQIPTFDDKAEALYYFPMFRTWFSLQGLCKLPWNDITPASNKTAKEPAKVPEHQENYRWLYEGVTGEEMTEEKMILQAERVYYFQRVFNLRMGYGTREYDLPPYRMVGPVTNVEYESRVERYDKQLKDEAGIDPENMSTTEKVAAVRKYRTERYNTLVDTVYARRSWTKNGIPTVESLKRLNIDFPDVVDLVKRHGG
ncbi:MAG: aldehyde:ferredoxin oxidoreductase [Chloroflexi bacterium]|nr:aldehyde:ferredoxin oxidoreductase [Chloroflexota bacterium]